MLSLNSSSKTEYVKNNETVVSIILKLFRLINNVSFNNYLSLSTVKLFNRHIFSND